MRLDFKIALYGLGFGFGIAVVAMILPLRFPNIPPVVLDIMLLGGGTIALSSLLLIIYELIIRPRLAKEVKMIPLIMIIGGLSLFVGGIIYHLINKNPIENKSLDKAITEQQIPSKLTVSIRMVANTTKTGNLQLELSFHNDSPIECAIERIGIILPSRDVLLKLTNNDTLQNNYNNKPIASYGHFGDMIYIGFGVGPRILPILPLVLKAGQLYPLKVIIPFDIIWYFKNQEMSNVKKLIIGVRIGIMNYKGKDQELTMYPVAHMDIINDSKIGNVFTTPRTESFILE